MIIYPDGSTLYWLEGYPNEYGSNKDKKIITVEQTVNKLLQKYNDTDYQMTEKDLQTVMQIMMGFQQKSKK